jgi:hypothetical protein
MAEIAFRLGQRLYWYFDSLTILQQKNLKRYMGTKRRLEVKSFTEKWIVILGTEFFWLKPWSVSRLLPIGEAVSLSSTLEEFHYKKITVFRKLEIFPSSAEVKWTQCLLGSLGSSYFTPRIIKGPNIIGVYLPHMKMERFSISETLCFLVIQNCRRCTKSANTVILSVVHNRLNPSISTNVFTV